MNNIDKIKSLSKDNVDLNNEDWLEPSEKVWKGVKENLPKKRRRRNVLPFYFIFLGIVSAFIFYQSYSNTSKNKITQEIISNENFNTDPQLDVQITSEESIDNSVSEKNIELDNSSVNADKKNRSNVVKDNNEIVSNETTLKSESTINTNSKKKYEVNQAINKTDGKSKKGSHTTKNSTSKDEHETSYKNDEVTIQVTESENIIEIDQIQSLPFKTFDIPATLLDFSNNLFRINSTLVECCPSKPFYIGVGFTTGLASNKKLAVTGSDPLTELLTSSVYKNYYSFSLEYNKVLNRKFSFSIQPYFSVDRLYSTYSLNIPYDYNTEVINAIENENTFSHSLPTDIGNIKTKLVVTRASNSPVSHNEIINFDFSSKHQILSFALPLKLNYHFVSPEKGFFLYPSLIPEFEISKKLSADYLKSNHTFVHTKSAEISQDFNVSRFHLGLGAGVGYRFSLMDRFLFSLNTNYTRFINPHGRRELLNAGTTLFYKF